jgi:crotonobetainyl-CoA:carnitine CoA-transferase CaiB-like acyl-CoA transferase
MPPAHPPDDQPDPPPLAGLLIADFSRVLAGPLASMFLADLGATVVKVERPGSGDDTRSWGPPYVDGVATYYTSVNRNKLSVALDLTDPGDLRLAGRLACRADVLLENYRPGKLAEFGLDAAAVAADNPGLVYCSISGFGPGAGADLPGYDFVVQAVGGLMSITGEPGGPPVKAGVALVDVLTGLHAAIGILAALRERERSGRGQVVQVNLLSSLVGSLANQGAAYINGAGVPSAMGNRHPSIAPYETLQARDAPIAVAAGNDRQFAALAACLGRPELAADPRFAANRDRVANRDPLVAALESALSARDAADWTARLQRCGVPCGPVNDIGAAIDLAAGLGLDPVVRHPAEEGPGVATLANPITLSRSPVRYHRAPPALGADDCAVRAWLSDDARAAPGSASA